MWFWWNSYEIHSLENVCVSASESVFAQQIQLNENYTNKWFVNNLLCSTQTSISNTKKKPAASESDEWYCICVSGDTFRMRCDNDDWGDWAEVLGVNMNVTWHDDNVCDRIV